MRAAAYVLVVLYGVAGYVPGLYVVCMGRGVLHMAVLLA
jgi:hypothetical protein